MKRPQLLRPMAPAYRQALLGVWSVALVGWAAFFAWPPPFGVTAAAYGTVAAVFVSFAVLLAHGLGI